MDSVDFNRLTGIKAALHYCSDDYCFQLGDVIFEVVENEDDGYRSSMDEVRIVEREALSKYPHNHFLEEVTILAGDEDSMWKILGADGHRWLQFGTRDASDYYPTFVFDWTPRQAQVAF